MEGDKESDVALISLRRRLSHHAADLHSVERLTSWHLQVRPVVCALRVSHSAAVSGEKVELMVLDPGTDTPFVIRRPAMWSLAKQREWVPSYRNPKVAEHISAVVELMRYVAEVRVMPAAGIATERADGKKLLGGGSGPELNLEVSFAPSATAAQREAELAYLQQVLSYDPEFLELVDSLHVTGTPTRQA